MWTWKAREGTPACHLWMGQQYSSSPQSNHDQELRSQHACILACMDNMVIRVLTSTSDVVLISAPSLL